MNIEQQIHEILLAQRANDLGLSGNMPKMTIKEAKTKLIDLMSYRTVNRFEVIDHLRGGRGEPYSGRFTRWEDRPFKVELSEQDDNRTLKIFLSELNSQKGKNHDI